MDSGVVGAVCGEEALEVENMVLEDGEVSVGMPRVGRASWLPWVEEGVGYRTKFGQLVYARPHPP